jgi:uncharacterized membrane protein YdjX (TVP38/TMEM64 family)
VNKKIIFRILLLIALTAGITIFFGFDLQQYLTLKFLRESHEVIQNYYDAQPLQMMVTFFCIYLFTTALSLPGAAVLSLAGGAVFGLTLGTLMVSFASSIGATLAMLASRFLLKDWVQQRFEKQLKTINEGVLKEGGFYLFTLRLVPVIPFFVINLVMGLMPIRWWTFYWVSQIGMFAGTLVFVNAGAELGQIQSARDILSPMLNGSFILLGMFPLIMKSLLSWIKTRRQLV